MERAVSKIKQGDISRALKAARSAGFEVGAIEIRPDGVLQISRVTSPTASPIAPPLDPFETWKARRDAR